MFSCREGRQALLPAPGGCACATRSSPSVVLSLVYLNVNGVGHNDFWKERKKRDLKTIIIKKETKQNLPL